MIDWFLRFEHGQKFAPELVSASNELANSIIGEYFSTALAARHGIDLAKADEAPQLVVQTIIPDHVKPSTYACKTNSQATLSQASKDVSGHWNRSSVTRNKEAQSRLEIAHESSSGPSASAMRRVGDCALRNVVRL